MRHAFESPDAGTLVQHGSTPSPDAHHTLATGPQFSIVVLVAQHAYAGFELAAGTLVDGPAVQRDGVSVTDSGFYIGVRSVVGLSTALGPFTLGAELAPGLNEVSYESPTERDRKGNPVRFGDLRADVDVRSRLDVAVTSIVDLGILVGTSVLDRHDLSVAAIVRLRSPRP